MRKKIYISGPITNGDRNENFFQAAQMEKRLMIEGFAPLNPMRSMVMPHAWDKELTHGVWLSTDLPWVLCADAVIRLYGQSVGADLECDLAEENGIPVFYSYSGFQAWEGFSNGSEAIESEGRCR